MDNLTKQIESLLFYTGEETKISRIASLCEVSKSEAQQALEDLQTELEDRGVSLITHDDTAQLVTDESFSDFITEVKEGEIDTNLTSAQSEALAVIAYLSPVKKVRIDFVRGVNSRAVLRNLSARGLIAKKKDNGVVVYKLTAEALAHLGITSQEDLPDYQETREKLQKFSESEVM